MAINNIPLSLEEDVKLQGYKSKLAALRQDGVTKLADTKQLIYTTKKSKMISQEAKGKLLSQYAKDVESAKADAAKHKAEIDSLTKEAVAYVNNLSKKIEDRVKEEENANIAAYKAEYDKQCAAVKARLEERISKVTISDPKERKAEIDTIKYEAKSALFDAKSQYTTKVDRSKAAKNQAYVDHVQTNRSLRNGKTNFAENMKLKFTDYVNKFKLSKFLLDNGLYLAIAKTSSLIIYETSELKIVQKFVFPNAISQIAWSPDSALILIAFYKAGKVEMKEIGRAHV